MVYLMIKKCPNCGKKINNKNELSAKFCSNCGTELITILDRKISPGLRKEVFMRDGYRCVECGATKDESRLEVDHIIPISKGGTNDIDNLQTLCRECNQNKSNIVFPDGIEIDIEITENELNRLNNLLQQNKKKLNDVTDNDELIDIKYSVLEN